MILLLWYELPRYASQTGNHTIPANKSHKNDNYNWTTEEPSDFCVALGDAAISSQGVTPSLAPRN